MAIVAAPIFFLCPGSLTYGEKRELGEDHKLHPAQAVSPHEFSDTHQTTHSQHTRPPYYEQTAYGKSGSLTRFQQYTTNPPSGALHLHDCGSGQQASQAPNVHAQYPTD